MVRAEGLEPSWAVCGLESPHPSPEDPELRCCPSSSLHFPGLCPFRLGSGLPFEVSPTFVQFCLASSPKDLSQINPLRLPVRQEGRSSF
jgi:hypothetical protein